MVPYSLRPLTTDAADADSAWQVVRDAELALALADPSTRDRIDGLLAGLADLNASRLAFAGDRPVGLLLVCPVPGRTVFLEVHVGMSGPRPLLELLVDQGVAAARTIAARDPSARELAATPMLDGRPDPNRWQVGAAPDSTDAAYRRVLTGAGFLPGLRFWRMRLDLHAPSEHQVDATPPRGVSRTYARSMSDLRLVHDVFTDAFRDHESSVPVPFEQWWHGLSTRPGFDPDGVWLAWESGKPIGMCIVDDSRADVGDGFLRNVGVLRPARGRGIGRWLVACAVGDSMRRQRRGISLTVDSGSTTGAPQLYESMGFRVRQTTEDWRRGLE